MSPPSAPSHHLVQISGQSGAPHQAATPEWSYELFRGDINSHFATHYGHIIKQTSQVFHWNQVDPSEQYRVAFFDDGSVLPPSYTYLWSIGSLQPSYQEYRTAGNHASIPYWGAPDLTFRWVGTDRLHMRSTFSVDGYFIKATRTMNNAPFAFPWYWEKPSFGHVPSKSSEDQRKLVHWWGNRLCLPSLNGSTYPSAPSGIRQTPDFRKPFHLALFGPERSDDTFVILGFVFEQPVNNTAGLYCSVDTVAGCHVAYRPGQTVCWSWVEVAPTLGPQGQVVHMHHLEKLVQIFSGQHPFTGSFKPPTGGHLTGRLSDDVPFGLTSNSQSSEHWWRCSQCFFAHRSWPANSDHPMHSAHGQVAGSVCRNRNLFLAWFRELNRANLDGRKAFDPPLNLQEYEAERVHYTIDASGHTGFALMTDEHAEYLEEQTGCDPYTLRITHTRRADWPHNTALSAPGLAHREWRCTQCHMKQNTRGSAGNTSHAKRTGGFLICDNKHTFLAKQGASLGERPIRTVAAYYEELARS